MRTNSRAIVVFAWIWNVCPTFLDKDRGRKKIRHSSRTQFIRVLPFHRSPITWIHVNWSLHHQPILKTLHQHQLPRGELVPDVINLSTNANLLRVKQSAIDASRRVKSAYLACQGWARGKRSQKWRGLQSMKCLLHPQQDQVPRMESEIARASTLGPIRSMIITIHYFKGGLLVSMK
jgi:hypothetical protein